MRPAGSPQALGRRRQGGAARAAARAADIYSRGGVFVPPPARRGAASAPLRLDCGRGVCPPPARLRAAFAPLRLDCGRGVCPPPARLGRGVCPPPARLRAPPSSPTPPQGGSDTGARLMRRPLDSPLEGGSRQPPKAIRLPPCGGVAEAEPPGWVRPVLRCRPIPTPFIPDPPLRPAPPPDPSRVGREPLPRRKARRRSGPPAPGNGSAPPAGIRRCAASGR